jgi:hypothetical protein
MHIIALFDDFCTSKQHSSTKEFLRKCVCSDGERPMKALYVLTKQMSNQFEVHTDAISRIIRNECDDRDLSPVAQRSTQILRSLCTKDGNADRKIIEALSRQIVKANISESVIWFRRNTVLLKYDLISGLRDNHLAVFFESKTASFFELELDIPINILNIVSASCSMNINIVQKDSLI